MSTTVLLSPPAGGKTSHCIQRILAVLREHPLDPIWVVLPDRLQAYAFRRRLADAGGAIGANVGTFGDLYREILRAADQSVPMASELIVHRLLQLSVQSLMERGELSYYAPLIQMPGFLRVLRGAIAELKRARIWPESFMDEAAKRSQGLFELARIYQSYQDTLGFLAWADREGINWLATEALEKNPRLTSDWPLLVVDGFDSFNGAQRAAIGLLGERLTEVIITLPGLPETDRVALRRLNRSLQSLVESVPSIKVETLTQDTHLLVPLAHIEKSIFETSTEGLDPGSRVLMIEATSPAEEVREALRWLKARIERDGIELSKCGLIAADLESYFPFLRVAAAEFGMPLRTFHGEPLSSSPPITALLDLLELPLSNFSRRLMLEAVRSPYFELSHYGLSPMDAYRLEVVSQHGQVIEGMDQWRETLELLSQVERFTEDLDGEARGMELSTGESAHQLLIGLEAFTRRLAIPGARSLGDWVRWLEDLMDDIHFLEERETARDEAAFLHLREILRSFVLGDVIGSGGKIEAPVFLAGLREILEASQYQEKPNWIEPAILVLTPHGARGLRFDAVAVLGLAEGIFPEVEREDPFIPEEVRIELDLEPRLVREQGGLFYQAVTRADQFLLLSRPYLADDGEYWEPSPYWNAIASLFKVSPIKVQSETPRPLADAASSQELLFWAVRRHGLPVRFADAFMDQWERLRRSRDVLLARQRKTAEGPFEGVVQHIAVLLQERYGPDYLWSPSRLETYGSCPYRFYTESALEFERKIPPEPGFDALQLGTMLHSILEEAYRRVEDPTDVDAIIEGLDSLALEVFSHAPYRLGFRPSVLWHVEQEQLLVALKATVLGLAELSEGWKPFAFERVFGIKGEPPLEIDIEGMRVLLRGIIDRLDVDEEGNLRVLDYKTGSGHLAPVDLIGGRRLQLPLYALAASQALRLGKPVDGLYWAILKADAGRLRLQRFHYESDDRVYAGLNGAIGLALEHVAKIVCGVHKGDFPPIPPRGGCPSYCAAALWCWRYRSTDW
jgi:ATP-dependent helicase/nuclease subunit B